MSKSPTTTTTTTTSVHPRNPSPSLASTTRPSSPVKSTPTIKSSPPSPAVTAPSHAPHHHGPVVQEKPKSRYKKTNKQECKRKPKFCSRTQCLGFQREVQPVQLPATASSRWSTTSHHGRLHLQRRQVLTTYPLRCKSSWYLLHKRTLILAISVKKFFDRQHLQGDCLCPA